jgi:tape measure domain-containing protein
MSLAKMAKMQHLQSSMYAAGQRHALSTERLAGAYARATQGMVHTRVQARRAAVAMREMAHRRNVVGLQAQGAALAHVGQMLMQVARIAAIAGVAIGAFFLKSAFQAAAFSERMQMGLKMVAGSAAAGKEAYRSSIAMAKLYGLSVQETVKQMVKLLAVQFKMGEAKDIIKMGADMKALGATGQEVASIIRAITQIKGKGKLLLEELQRQLAETGISVQMVIAQLGKTLGKSSDEIRKMISAGEISADVGIEAIKQTIKQKLGIEKLGDAALKTAKTIGGMWNVLKAYFGAAMLELGNKLVPILKSKLVPLLQKVFAYLDSPAAMSAIEQTAVAIGILVDAVMALGEGMKSTMQPFVEQIGKMAKAMGFATGETDDWLAGLRIVGQMIGTAVGITLMFASAIMAVVHAIGWVKSTFEGVWASVSAMSWGELAISIGTGIIQGLVSGIFGGLSSVVNAIISVVTSALAVGKAVLGIGSPSKVWAGIGKEIPAGLSLGIASGAPAVAATTAAMVKPPPMGGGGTSIGSVSAPMKATFNVSGAEDPAATAATIKGILQDQVQGMFEQVAIEIGVTGAA